MPRESLGYVKLEWTCPNCGGRNPGPEKTCLSCGSPQPEDVQFEEAPDKELIQDEKELERAKAGPDIHCGFCGTRNPAGTLECSQCGADLVHGAILRRGGRRLSHREGRTGRLREAPSRLRAVTRTEIMWFWDSHFGC